MNVCRVCLSEKPLCPQVSSGKKDSCKSYSNMFQFCLDIQVEEDSKITSKLCYKCFKKLLTFDKFKTMALKNDAYLRSLLLIDDITCIKSEPVEPLHEDEVLIEPVACNENDDMKSENDEYGSEVGDELSLAKEISVDFNENDDIKSENLDEYGSEVEDELSLAKEISVDFNENDDIKSENLDEYGSEVEDELSLAKEISVDSNAPADSTLEVIQNHIKPKPKTQRSNPLRKTRKPHSQIQRPKLLKKTKTQSQDTNEYENGPGICDQCGASVRNLKDHALKHLPIQHRKRYPCKLCEKIYMTPGALRTHHKIKHLGILSHCDVCNKDVTDLKSHQLARHRRDNMPQQCAVCSRRFPTRSALERHASLHSGERAFQCDHCGKSFGDKFVLDKHIRTVHLKEINYFCTVCNKGFFRKCNLDLHIRTHTKEKPCKCVECGKCFATPTGLTTHMRGHSDVKAYHCPMCDKSFLSASTLYMHKRAHRQEKPYKCRHCDVSYARTFDRNKHERKYHPEQNTNQSQKLKENCEKPRPPDCMPTKNKSRTRLLS